MKIIRGKDHKIEWHGDDFVLEMDRNLEKLVEKKAAENIEKRAKTLCPVGKTITTSSGKSWKSRKPGTLKRTIRARKSKFKNGGWIVSAGSNDAFYAGFVELGTKRMSAKPYLRPALHVERHKLGHYLSDVKRRSRYLKSG